MSILNDEPINEPQPAEIAVQRLIQITKRTYQQMVNSFNEGSKIFWQNPDGLTPAEMAMALGTDGKEIFQLHYKLGELIASIKPETIQEGLSVIGQFMMNEDGTVTIVSDNQPQSEQE